MAVLELRAADRAALERVVGSPSSPQAVVARARIVLACASAPTVAEVARTLGVSRDVVTRWRDRFASGGLPALGDRRRRGRPRTVADGGVSLVLSTLLAPGGPWSTRSLAAATGLSQSTVSRIVRSLWPPVAGVPAVAAFRHVAGVYFDGTAAVLALAGDAGGAVVSGRARQVARTGSQTLLAAVAIARSAAAAPSGLRAFLVAVDRAVPARGQVVVLLAGADASWLPHQTRLRPLVVAPEVWHAQAEQVLTAPGLDTGDLADLTGALRAWDRSSPFSWVPRGRVITDSPEDRLHRSVAAGTRPAERVVPVLRESIARGRFQPGERIREAPLAARLGVSRATAREALRSLAADGLLELLPNRGAAIPRMRAGDVLETYAARAALGSLLVRRLATRGPGELTPVAKAVAEVRDRARSGQAEETAEADLAFQEAMAEAADLPRTALHFNRLGVQLRMFISILGLDYTGAVPRMIHDAGGILAALRSGSPEEAAARWRGKIEYAVRYMIGRLPLEDFDAGLWTTLTGGPGRGG
ncbi:GntR family transcriptional regulator [Amycolatopsis thermophila]|uniref:DNA-binding GntR family transcriptional regulator/transcriptional regulator with XRE-family HTH domain n=1 Tax=Amycolatopsis thermophila TaxID=206084 RepID=A0ABU0ELU6_9PSEU|nr:helix-turn-helix domain-containing protein [Amycolatopsis thermophila]MDQ0376263.1 DNA-binding GntR family transcriptional regulator/transcriptional regulator with XRE-family HTH domain [Amycolatopsis thermophila]